MTDPAPGATPLDPACVAQLDARTRLVAVVNPHRLRQGRASCVGKTATPTALMQLLGHRRVATTLTEGD